MAIDAIISGYLHSVVAVEERQSRKAVWWGAERLGFRRLMGFMVLFC